MRKTLSARLVRIEQTTANNWQSFKTVRTSMTFGTRACGYVSKAGVFWSLRRRLATNINLCEREVSKVARRVRLNASRVLRLLDEEGGRRLPG